MISHLDSSAMLVASFSVVSFFAIAGGFLMLAFASALTIAAADLE